jgi:glycosyltransferase involved in cell wall biosynthesis
LKLALVHELLVKLGGAERVLRVLADQFPEAPIYTLLHNAKKTDEWFKEKIIHPSNLQSAYRLFGNHRILLPWMSKAIESFDFNNYDVVISSSSAFAHGIKTGPNTKHICYCHSPMRYAWDYTHEYTKHHSPLMRFAIAKTLNKVRQWDFETSGRPDILLANSKHVQKRIQKYWRRDSEVVYPPVDVKRFTPTGKHEDYFLIVAALTPFKNIELAIRVFNKIRRKLVIIGDGAQRDWLESIAEDNIEFLGRKDDQSVKDYLENCRALIFPGEEDFGIVPVEAMASGKPVLAFGKGGVLESVQPGVSGEFFLESTPQSLEDGLARLMANEPRYDPLIIRSAAEQFDTAVFSKKIAEWVKKAAQR